MASEVLRKTMRKAVHWFTKSAEQGFAEAQNNLGVMYENGRGVPQNYRKAIGSPNLQSKVNAQAHNLGLTWKRRSAKLQKGCSLVHQICGAR